MIGEVDTNKKFCVYVYTNKINGKRYVGVTSQDPEKRWENGKGYTRRQPHMYNAIQKWGWNNFSHEILMTNISANDASTLECMLIKAWKLQDPQYGYNSQSGGLINATLSEEIRKKQSEARKGVKFTEEHKQNLSKARANKPLSEKQQEVIDRIKYWNKDKKLSEEHKQKISNALIGRDFSEEHRRNISNSKKGQFTEKQKESMSKVWEGNIGRKHTEESRSKISAGNKGKIQKNSVKLKQYNLNTKEVVGIYNSVMEAHNKTGVSYHSIWNCINGISKSAGGFTWIKIDN